jgi:hypothetical protein
MSLPNVSGKPPKRSQRNQRKPEPVTTLVTVPRQVGEIVNWRTYTGSFLRDLGNGNCLLEIAGRRWCVAIDELR